MKTIKNKDGKKAVRDQAGVLNAFDDTQAAVLINHAASREDHITAIISADDFDDQMTAVIDTTDSDAGDHAAENATPRTVGYARVSSREQNLDRQLIALEDFGIDQIFMDKQSGKDFLRPAYQEMLVTLQPGDVLVVKSIDRLGRNYEEILAQWRLITKEKQVAIVVLDMPLLDTRNSRDLTGTLIADIVLQLLSYVAETERSYIHERQREGIAAARARGVHLGRPRKPRGEAYQRCAALWSQGLMSAREAATELGIAHTTFLSWVRE